MNRSAILLVAALLLPACAAVPQPGPSPAQAIASSQAIGSVQIQQIDKIAAIKPLIAQLPVGSVLLVLDIDDTLLTSPTFFGSDSWYEWQKQKNIAAAAVPACLFDAIALNYEFSPMTPVEGKEGVDFINELDAPKLLLTSRSSMYRGATERELLANRYKLPLSLQPRSDGLAWYNVQDGKAALISYINGIAMVSGRDKGESLIELLQRVDRHYQNIVLVDDGLKNIKSLARALPSKGYSFYGFLYTAVPKTFRDADLREGIVVPEADQRVAEQRWQDWLAFVSKQYPGRAARWAKNPAECAP